MEVQLWKKGDAGEEVRLFQSYLGFLGFYDSAPNSQFDDRTEAAVRAFEKDEVENHGAKFEDDGVAGDLTWKSLILRTSEKIWSVTQMLEMARFEIDQTKQFAKSELDETKQQVLTITRSEIEQAKQSAKSEIEEAKLAAKSEIDATRQEIITTATSAIAIAAQSAQSNINEAKQSAKLEIDSTKQEIVTAATAAVNTAKQSAKLEIDQAKQNAVDTAKAEVNTAKDEAVTAAKAEVQRAALEADRALKEDNDAALQSAIAQKEAAKARASTLLSKVRDYIRLAEVKVTAAQTSLEKMQGIGIEIISLTDKDENKDKPEISNIKSNSGQLIAAAMESFNTAKAQRDLIAKAVEEVESQEQIVQAIGDIAPAADTPTNPIEGADEAKRIAQTAQEYAMQAKQAADNADAKAKAAQAAYKEVAAATDLLIATEPRIIKLRQQLQQLIAPIDPNNPDLGPIDPDTWPSFENLFMKHPTAAISLPSDKTDNANNQNGMEEIQNPAWIDLRNMFLGTASAKSK
jgi:hypothetical protein